MRQYISNEKYELIKDNLDSKDTYVIVDGENVDKVAFRTNNITGQNAMYEIIPGATPTGTYNITENGEYDVATYASAIVDVSGVWDEKYTSLFNNNITYLDSTYIPSGTTSLRDGFCYRNSYLTSVDLPNVTNIGQRAFDNCTNLTYVNVPNVTSIGNFAFSSCTNLTYVNLPNATTISDSTFEGCTSLSSIDLQNVTSVGAGAFDKCPLSSVDLPNVTSIGASAFSDTVIHGGTGLTTVDLGPNVTSIDPFAFSNNYNLTSFTCRAITPPTLGIGVFNRNSDHLVIYVPAESVDAYKAASGWSVFADKIQAIVE